MKEPSSLRESHAAAFSGNDDSAAVEVAASRLDARIRILGFLGVLFVAGIVVAAALIHPAPDAPKHWTARPVMLAELPRGAVNPSLASDVMLVEDFH